MHERNLLVLTGATPVLEPTPGMLTYGVSKCAVHFIIRSLAVEGAGLPNGCASIGILPVTIDTPTNRQVFPSGNYSDWSACVLLCDFSSLDSYRRTPPEEFAQFLLDSTDSTNQCKNGGLYRFDTKSGRTRISIAN